MNTFYKSFAITFLFIGAIGLAPISHAEEYNLSYGARLTEANGAPISGQDGKLDLEVSFYNVGAGGSPIVPSPISFPATSIAEGVFQLNIALTPADFHQVFQDPSTPVYIEVKDVKSGATFPRQRFSVIPFALKTPIDNDTIVYNSDGKLTVGSNVGTVKQITAGSGLTGGTFTDSGTITVDAGTTGNKIVQLNEGKLPSVDGSNLSSVNAEKLQTRNISAAVPVSGQVLKWSGSAWVPSSDLVGETGSGEANTASNVTSGSGVGLFKAKVSADLRFYSLSPGAGVTVNLVGDDVAIASTITQYTDAMAKAAAVADSIADSVTTIAPSQNAVFDALTLKSETTHNHDTTYEPKGLSTDVVTTTKILNDAVTSAKIASGVDSAKIGSGAVDNTEFSYLNGVTSAIQTQINGKVVGPVSATDNAIVRFDGTTGKLAQDSSVVIDDSGRLGIGTTTPSELSLLHIDKTYTNETLQTRQASSTWGQNVTTNGTYDFSGFYTQPTINIASGISNSGGDIGFYANVLRKASSDNGTLTRLEGIRSQYGHYTGAGASALTTSAYGLFIGPYHMSGTITNSYGIYLGNSATGGIVTNYYGLYSADINAKNYFAGKVGIGTTTPNYTLDVSGSFAMTNTTGSYAHIAGYGSGNSGSTLQFEKNDDAGNNRTLLARLFSTHTNHPDHFQITHIVNGATMGVLSMQEDGNLTYLGNNVGIGTTSPSQKLSVAGTIESTSGGIKFPDGTTQTSATSSSFGSWESKASGTVYQASSNGFVVANVYLGRFSVETDSSNPPTTMRGRVEAQAANASEGTVTIPVKKGDYWKVSVASGSPTVFWMPLN